MIIGSNQKKKKKEWPFNLQLFKLRGTCLELTPEKMKTEKGV